MSNTFLIQNNTALIAIDIQENSQLKNIVIKKVILQVEFRV